MNYTKPKELPTVAEFISLRIEIIDKSQKQIAEESGFEHPNVISMIKQGTTKLPITKICPVAKALNVDPAHLLRIVMLEYLPDAWEVIEEALNSTVLTANELELIRAFREVTGGNDAKAMVIERDAVLAIVVA